jgi:hypothetical protein
LDGQLILSYPYWFLVLCLLLGLAVAIGLYRKDKLFTDYPILRGILFGCRTIAVAGIAFLLLGPIWKGIITKTDKPIVIYMEDISASVATYTPKADFQSFQEQKAELLQSLSKQFEVSEYQFGAELIAMSDSLPGNEKVTNIADAINRMLEIHSYQNIGAVILATDGIYNQGASPAYTKVGNNTSIYTIALGDTTASKDLFIQQLKYPRVVYLGDKFQLDIDFGAYNLQGNAAKVQVFDERGNVLLDKAINIPQDEYFGVETVVIAANQPGVQKYKVQITTAASEDIATNNFQNAYVEVLDGRKSVLLLYHGPHPDIKALKTVIENNKNYQVEVSSIEQFNGTLDQFDLVLFHGIPAAKNSAKGKNLITEAKQKGTSMAIVVTDATDLNALNSLQSVLKIKPSGQASSPMQGLFNSNFNDFQLPNGLADAFRSYPPLNCPFGDYVEGANTKTLVFQRLDNINTGYPMIITGMEGNSRMLVISGEGLWRWRMEEFAKNGSSAIFDQLFNQMVQYVAIKEDKRRFRLFTGQQLIWENESVFFNAELYNANYELINNPDVSVLVKGENGQEYTFVLDRTLNAYSLEAGLLPIGNYTATAQTTWANENFTASVQFTVREVQLETLNKQANHKMLFNLSDAGGGKMFNIPEMGQIMEEIDANVNLKPIQYNTVKTTSLLHFKWLFFILLALLTIEWVARKWTGGF